MRASALSALRPIFREGLAYQKAGVMLGGLEPRAGLTECLFTRYDRGRSERLMAVLDDVNRWLGPDTLRYAAAGFERPWHMRREHASPPVHHAVGRIADRQSPLRGKGPMTRLGSRGSYP